MSEPILPSAAGPTHSADAATSSAADPRPTTDDRPAGRVAAAERYLLKEEIARGGMGAVYRATDTVLGREVVVKVLQEKFAPGSGAAHRFADEARIAAQLQHPGIPPVHDLGTLPDGRPFLAMKLIKGQDLDQLLKARDDVAAERGRFVAVFEQVCQALAYAHSHGVIHRDLKPSNVMVGAFGEVQVMDWGLAKVLGSKSGDGEGPQPAATWTHVMSPRDSDGQLTEAGSVLGTPAYMPPEQAIGAVDQIDAQCDVFGLGGVLAAILTGRPPFVADSAESTRQMAARGKVQECFARLDSSGADPKLVALCKRCLSPEKAERPANAGEVARSVAELRTAADERARRAELDRAIVEGERAAAEARSLERRRRRRLILGALMVLVLVTLGGLAAVLQVQRRANKDLADKNTALAEQQHEVEARFELARKAIAAFHTGVSEDTLLKNPDLTELRRKLLQEAAGFYGDLEKLLVGRTDPRSRRLLASGQFQLGELTEKVGDKTEALAVQRKALALRRELAAAPGASVEDRLEVARSLRMVGSLLNETGDSDRALAAFQEMRDLAQALEAGPPADNIRTVLAQGHFDIGWVLSATQRKGEALEAYAASRDIRQQLADAGPAVTQFQSDLAHSHNAIGVLLGEMERPAEALKAHEEALSIRRKLADASPGDPQFQGALAVSHYNIALVLWQMGRPAEALAAYEKARDIQQKLADASPAVTKLQRELANSHASIAFVLSDTGRPVEALAVFAKALAIQQKLADANPTVAQFQLDLALSHSNLGGVLFETGRPAEALAAYEKARDIQQTLADASPTVLQYQNDLANSYTNIGTVLERARPAAALAAHKKARNILQKLADSSPAVPWFRSDLASSHGNVGRSCVRLERFAEAFAALDTGQALCQKLVDAHPTSVRYVNNLAISHVNRGWAHARAGHAAFAAADLRRALELMARDKAPDLDMRFERSLALALLAGLGREAKSGVTAAEAAAFADQSVAVLRDAIQAGWARADELQDPDFDPLRKRDHFQKLVKEAEARSAANHRGADKQPEPENK
jgi:tetratricopeptide (TPR) repeat protein